MIITASSGHNFALMMHGGQANSEILMVLPSTTMQSIEQVFDHRSKYSKALLFGLQRSGTTTAILTVFPSQCFGALAQEQGRRANNSSRLK
tara:strand:- start:492 stop:764 length:273 start_codon:yes stop_codon:yes gene_type:complete